LDTCAFALLLAEVGSASGEAAAEDVSLVWFLLLLLLLFLLLPLLLFLLSLSLLLSTAGRCQDDLPVALLNQNCRPELGSVWVTQSTLVGSFGADFVSTLPPLLLLPSVGAYQEDLPVALLNQNFRPVLGSVWAIQSVCVGSTGSSRGAVFVAARVAFLPPPPLLLPSAGASQEDFPVALLNQNSRLVLGSILAIQSVCVGSTRSLRVVISVAARAVVPAAGGGVQDVSLVSRLPQNGRPEPGSTILTQSALSFWRADPTVVGRNCDDVMESWLFCTAVFPEFVVRACAISSFDVLPSLLSAVLGEATSSTLLTSLRAEAEAGCLLTCSVLSLTLSSCFALSFTPVVVSDFLGAFFSSGAS
jgi:hypothetical protein